MLTGHRLTLVRTLIRLPSRGHAVAARVSSCQRGTAAAPGMDPNSEPCEARFAPRTIWVRTVGVVNGRESFEGGLRRMCVDARGHRVAMVLALAVREAAHTGNSVARIREAIVVREQVNLDDAQRIRLIWIPSSPSWCFMD